MLGPSVTLPACGCPCFELSRVLALGAYPRIALLPKIDNRAAHEFKAGVGALVCQASVACGGGHPSCRGDALAGWRVPGGRVFQPALLVGTDRRHRLQNRPGTSFTG